jgi:hypothetical protein
VGKVIEAELVPGAVGGDEVEVGTRQASSLPIISSSDLYLGVADDDCYRIGRAKTGQRRGFL